MTSANGTFRSTRWSLVARAGAADVATARKALGELCELYWYPLYAYLRRRGDTDADALDMVQAFCAQLLERGGLDGADANAGPFRHYLLGALRHFADNEARRERAHKRGGGQVAWSLDHAAARYAAEPATDESPERLFERRFAPALLARAVARLRDEYAARQRTALLEALEPALLGQDGALRHQGAARRLGITEGAVKVALHRLRARMRELIRDEVRQTLADGDDQEPVDDELRRLFAALSG
jgi:RNA polymerase sigma-70 factor (ECF subfamily)